MQKDHRPRTAGEGRMSRSIGGEGGNVFRYAKTIVHKLNQGSRRRKDVPFHRGRGGKHTSSCLYNCIIVYKLNQGRRRRKDVRFNRGGGGEHVAAAEAKTSRSTGGGGGKNSRYANIIVRKDVPFHRGGGGKHVAAGEGRVYKLKQGSRRRKDVPCHRGGRGETRGMYACMYVGGRPN